MTGSAGTAMDVLVTRALLTKGGEFERREPKMGGARHLRRRPFEPDWEKFVFRVFFREMSLKHSACHTFRASRAPCNTPKSHFKSRKIDSVGAHISVKKQSKSVAGAVKVQSR